MNKQHYAYFLNYLFPDNDYVGDVTQEIMDILDKMVQEVPERDFVRVRWGMGYFDYHIFRDMEGVFTVKKQSIHTHLLKAYMRLRSPEIRKELHDHMKSIGCNLNWKDTW